MKGFYVVRCANPWLRIREAEGALGYVFWDEVTHRWATSSLAGPKLMVLREELNEICNELKTTTTREKKK